MNNDCILYFTEHYTAWLGAHLEGNGKICEWLRREHESNVQCEHDACQTGILVRVVAHIYANKCLKNQIQLSIHDSSD